MSKILFVEDNALIAHVYSQKLAEAGFEVAVAEDGLAAMKRLPEFMPDLVVLDLLMPKFTGADVLRFMRSHPQLKSTRVIVFSNSFLSNLVEQIAGLGVEQTLIKTGVTPRALVETIRTVLSGPAHGAAETTKPATATATAMAAEKAKPAAEPATAKTEAAPGRMSESDTDFLNRLQQQMRDRPHVIFKELRELGGQLLEAKDVAAQAMVLNALKRKAGFLTQIMGMANYARTAELSSALEALLFELIEHPNFMNDSVRQTIASTIAFLSKRFESSGQTDEPVRPEAAILVVDDEAISTRAVVQALERAQLPAVSVTDAAEALKKIEKTAFDIALVDINLPGMDGLKLCEKMRDLPNGKKTAVIFVTGMTDFKTRLRSILSGGNDLITKPILASELCVKVVTHLLKEG